MDSHCVTDLLCHLYLGKRLLSHRVQFPAGPVLLMAPQALGPGRGPASPSKGERQGGCLRWFQLPRVHQGLCRALSSEHVPTWIIIQEDAEQGDAGEEYHCNREE